MTISIQFNDGYILDLTEVSTAKANSDTRYLELTKHDGTETRKQFFNLDSIITYSILTDPVNEIVK